MQGELFRAHAHIRPRRENFFAHKARQHGDVETTNTTARPQQGTAETDITSAPENRAKKHRFRTRKGDGGFNPTQIPASKGDGGFRQASHLADRARLRYPWAAADPGRATSGRPTLQTSSNQHDSNHLARTPVTNVVNLSPKTSIFSEKALGLTTFVTTGQKSTRKTPWIDDVCNNSHPSTPKTQHARPP